MSRRSRVARAVFAVFIGAGPMMTWGWVLHAQNQPAPVFLLRTEAREFTSKITGLAYRVSVALPEVYAANADKFPVIYLTDPDWTFGLTVQTHRILRLTQQVPEALVVGIERTGVDETVPWAVERTFHLTPTRNLDREREGSVQYKRDVRSGGAPDFLRVIREELIPDIERRYRTNGDRTYIGYSLGGLFGAYALFHAPDTFKRMILVSPSLWWDGGITSKYEERYAADHKSLPVRLFMSDGELEDDEMLGPMRRMSSVLTDRHYQGLDVQTRIFEGENHTSTFPVAVTRGLRVVFADRTSP